MMNTRLLAALCGAVLTMLSVVSHAAMLALESRLGGLAYYDPNLDITWVADANINGRDTWDNQVAWAAGLTIGGVSGWRLPSMDVNDDGTVVNCTDGGVAGCADNEMGFLFWEEGITFVAMGPFSNVEGDFYWSSTETTPTSARGFNFAFGQQGPTGKSTLDFAWAVRSGDVAVADPVDTDGDGDPDVTDPDDDNDGIGDTLDTDPLIASNLCTSSDGDNATLGVQIVADLTCAAQVSIDVQPATQVLGPPAHLHLIAPTIRFESGFGVLQGGQLTVKSADPCQGCSP